MPTLMRPRGGRMELAVAGPGPGSAPVGRARQQGLCWRGGRRMAGRGWRITMPVMGGERGGADLVVALLGPVEIGAAGGVMSPVSQPRLRVLLGVLAGAAGRVVGAQALVDGVWG